MHLRAPGQHPDRRPPSSRDPRSDRLRQMADIEYLQQSQCSDYIVPSSKG